MRRPPRVSLAFLMALGATLLSQGQSNTSAPQQQPPVFRGAANFVYVDVYARQDGRLVDDLRVDDFQVFEDGKLQRVQTIEFIRFETQTPEDERRDPNTKEDGERLAADPRNRVFVVYLDIYHTTFLGAHATRAPLLEFLDRTLSARDFFTVTTPEVPVKRLVFGRSLDTLRSELSTYYDWGLAGRPITPRAPAEEKLWLCTPNPDWLIQLYREEQFSSNLSDLMLYLRDLRDERKNLLLISEGWTPTAARPREGSGTIPRLGPGPGGRLGIGVPPLGDASNASWCDSMIMRLTNIDFEERFRELLRQASQANVSFYPFDVGGLKTNSPDASYRGLVTPDVVSDMRRAGQSKLDTLLTLAENTDGRAVVNTNDLRGGFKRVADDLSGYYLLGYSSTNSGLDGRFHRIDVKVARPRVSVVARRGYLAAVPDTRPGPSAPGAPEPLTAELGRLARLRADAGLFSYGVRSASGLDIVTELPSAQIGALRWRQGAVIEATATSDGAADVVATGRIEPGTRAGIVRLVVPNDANGPWRVSVRVRGAETVEDRIEILQPPTTVVGAPLVFRAGTGARALLQPVADFQFRRTERLRTEWPILKELNQRTARLLDRRGQPLAVPVSLTERDSTLAADVFLGPLAEADYVLELVVGSGGILDQQFVAFRVAR